MTINHHDPQRVDPPAEGQPIENSDWDLLGKSWQKSGRPRYFVHEGVKWMMIKDNQGICFVPSGRDDGTSGINGGSSFQKAMGG